AYRVDQEAEGRLCVHDAVVMKAPEVRARRRGRVHTGFSPDLPAVVQAADPVAGVATAVAETDLEVRAVVHDAAHDQGGERDRAVGQVADRVRQVIARRARADDGLAALVEEDEGAE